jgi:ubiquinone/menaquinone biosynthesis C-methylase UbiE
MGPLPGCGGASARGTSSTAGGTAPRCDAPAPLDAASNGTAREHGHGTHGTANLQEHASAHGHIAVRGHGGAHVHGQGGGCDRAAHDEWSAEEYARRLESPGRDRWQQPQALVDALGIVAGQRIAEVGTGSGYLLPYLSRAAGARGRVVAEDVRDDLLAIARARIAREGLTNVETRLGAFDDPRLEPGAYDLVLMVDVYHHIEDRGPFLRKLAAALARGGRLVVVDFRDGELPVGPPPWRKLPRAQVEQEVRMAGFVVARTHEFLPYQFVLELLPRSQLGEAAAAEQACGPAHGRPCGQTVERPRVVLDDDLTPTDAGFPAVSDDGTEIALAAGDDVGASSTFSVRFVRASDGATLRTRVLVSSQEAAAIEARGPSPALASSIRARVEALEAELLRGGFRSLRGVDLPDAGAPYERVLHPGAAIAWSPGDETLTARDTHGARRGALTLRGADVRCGQRTVAARGTPTRAWVDARGEVVVVRVRRTVEAGCVAPPSEDRVLLLETPPTLSP